jgi:hypothetical protein
MSETRPGLYDEPLLGLGFAETQKSKLPETYKKLAVGVLKMPCFAVCAPCSSVDTSNGVYISNGAVKKSAYIYRVEWLDL